MKVIFPALTDLRIHDRLYGDHPAQRPRTPRGLFLLWYTSGMSEYQSLKLLLVDLLGISKDGFHIIIGFLVFLIFSYIFKIKLSSYKALIAPFFFAFLLEAKDFYDSVAFGFLIDVPDAVHDIIITMLLLVLVVLYLKFSKERVD